MKQVVEEECVTGDKSLRIPFVARLDSMPLDEAGEWLQHHAVHHTIGIVNWPQVVDYRPDASFAIARGKERLYIHFMAAGCQHRAVEPGGAGQLCGVFHAGAGRPRVLEL